MVENLFEEAAAASIVARQKSIRMAHEALTSGKMGWDEVPFEIRKELLARGITRANI